MTIQNQLNIMKKIMDKTIKENGLEGKVSLIRSSKLINCIHEYIKNKLIELNVKQENIYPPYRSTSPEINISGFLKSKKQDICVVPSNIQKIETKIDWGPMSYQEKYDKYGYNYTTNILSINVRSQLSSVKKNTDTIFERTFAEVLNLRMRCPDIVLGEVFLLPVYEYDINFAKKNKVKFHIEHTNIEHYLSFFNAINNRKTNGNLYSYERCALLIVDFSKSEPYLYRKSDELKENKLISKNFNIQLETLDIDTFINDLLDIYSERYSIDNIKNKKL